MNDLISRGDAIKAVLVSNLSACTVFGRSEEGMATAKELIQVIKNLPSAQPERKTGKWKRTYLDHEAMGERPSIFYCSACNQCIAYPVNYCPSCGADMRGEE